MILRISKYLSNTLLIIVKGNKRAILEALRKETWLHPPQGVGTEEQTLNEKQKKRSVRSETSNKCHLLPGKRLLFQAPAPSASVNPRTDIQ